MAETLFWAALSLLLYTYIGYPVVLLLIAACKRASPPPETPQTWPTVSILLAAHNEESAIRGRIENLLDLDYPHDRLEIFVVSDASTDRTDSIVREFANRGVRFIARTKREGKTAALNYICPLARGEILLFTDANGAFDQDALKILVRHFTDPRVGCVCGTVKYSSSDNTAAHQGESLYMRYDSWVKELESRLGSVMGAFGGMFAFRRQFFDPMDLMVPVDMEIPLKVLRKGYKVLFEKSAVNVEPASGRVKVEFARHARINARLFHGMSRWISELLKPFRPFVLFLFMSKKALKWISPLFLFILIGAPFFIAGPFFKFVAMANILFLLGAGIGALLAWLGKSQPVFSFMLHFLIGNLAVAWGFVAFLTGRQGPTWSVAREADRA
jgi:cellulose synthase/poly-beta-1,6-N-acetylglucosamine synthase-like glycosyltransferase